MRASGPVFGSVRVRSRVRVDGGSTTWEAWDTTTGERLLLRTFPHGIPDGIPEGASVGVEGGPHLRSAPFVCALADVDRARPPRPALWSAALYLSILQQLVPLHASGRTHGWIGPRSVVARRTGWSLVHLGPVDAPTSDLAALAALLPAEDPVTELVAGFAEAPPPSMADAAALVLRACADALAAEHQAITTRARRLGRTHAQSRLRALVRRLSLLPPPTARGTLQVDDGALEVSSVSGAVHVTGAGIDQRLVIYGDGGLDPVSARAVLRAHAARPSPTLAPLMRWLAAAARLRADRLLLERP